MKFFKYRCVWLVGKRERVQMIVTGAQGHGLFSRRFMGSVAQRVLAESKIPTLLVKQS